MAHQVKCTSQTHPTKSQKNGRGPPHPPVSAPNLCKSCTRPYLCLCYSSEGSKIGVRAYGEILANPRPPPHTHACGGSNIRRNVRLNSQSRSCYHCRAVFITVRNMLDGKGSAVCAMTVTPSCQTGVIGKGIGATDPASFPTF
jgi:hypothetical protein